MKIILAALTFIPVIAFADCPVLTGSYSCATPVVVLDGAPTMVDVAIGVVTEGNTYTFSATKDGQVVSESWTADGEGVSNTDASGIEGVVISYQRIVCEGKKLAAYFRTSWYHEGRPAEGEVPAIDESLTQHFYLDGIGSLVQEDVRKRLYLGNERHPTGPTARVCPKITTP